MDNSISGVSFGAHLSLKNNSLYKHVSRDVANKFAKGTKNIEGTMTVRKGRCLKDLEFVLNDYNSGMVVIGADTLYKLNDKAKVILLKRIARYANELIKFAKLEKTGRVSGKNVIAHVKRLDKIVGKEDALHDMLNAEEYGLALEYDVDLNYEI